MKNKRVNGRADHRIIVMNLSGVDKFAYLFLVTDFFSRKILGYNISDNLYVKLGVKALRMALKNMSNTIH